MNVFESQEPTLVKVFSESCGPCRQLEPIIQNVLQKVQEVKYHSLNGPENRDLIKPAGITKVPTLVLVSGGVIKHKIEGIVSEAKIIAAINEHLLAK